MSKVLPPSFPFPSNASTYSYRCLNDQNWSVLYVDEGFRKVAECPPQDLISSQISFARLIKKDELKGVWDIVQDAVSKHVPFQLSYHIITPNDHIKTVFEQGEGVFVGNELIELRGFISDISYCPKVISSYQTEDIIISLQDELKNLIKGKNEGTGKLSSREVQTLVYICRGMTMKEIGIKLNISPRTVEMHVEHIKAKLQCSTKSELKKLFFNTKIGKEILIDI